MKQLGLVGYPLSHSFSPSYFKEKFERENITDYQYDLFETIDLIQFVEDCKQKENLVGFNITIPYKEMIVPFLDGISNEASYIGAVNTVKVIDGKLHGFNTDVFGFVQSLQPLLKDYHTKALILGTGGAAKAVKFGLKSLNIAPLLVSRYKQRGQITYDQLNKNFIENYKLIINTTPLGMHPNIDKSPAIPYEFLTDQHVCYDLIYNPETTQFMEKAKAQGAVVKNGLEMLQLQADKSWEIWTADNDKLQ